MAAAGRAGGRNGTDAMASLGMVSRRGARRPAAAPAAPPPVGAGGRPMLIGVAGGTASGKTSVCRRIMQELGGAGGAGGHGRLVNISMDCFYKDLSAEQHAAILEYNFDHPDAFDFGELHGVMENLRGRRRAEVPQYDYTTSSRLGTSTTVEGAEVVLLEGLFVLYDEGLREMLDMRVFVDTDADTRLARRIRRDVAERGRDVARVLDQYEATVKPSYDQYVQPTKRHADIVIPRGAENEVAIDLVTGKIAQHLSRCGTSPRALDAL